MIDDLLSLGWEGLFDIVGVGVCQRLGLLLVCHLEGETRREHAEGGSHLRVVLLLQKKLLKLLLLRVEVLDQIKVIEGLECALLNWLLSSWLLSNGLLSRVLLPP